MTPPEMTDEQIKSIDTRTLGYLHFARAIIAARDKQWAELLGEPVAWMQDSPELYAQDRPSVYYTIPLYALKQEKPE